MGSQPGPIDQCAPSEAWEQLKVDPSTALIDVRTRAEWAFVGIPDLSQTQRQIALVEWQRFPDMAVNQDFVAQLRDALGEELPARMFFICRSGARSMNAAHAVAEALQEQKVECINVAEGFEGDLDADGHRGHKNGWKAHGLPWRQK